MAIRRVAPPSDRRSTDQSYTSPTRYTLTDEPSTPESRNNYLRRSNTRYAAVAEQDEEDEYEEEKVRSAVYDGPYGSEGSHATTDYGEEEDNGYDVPNADGRYTSPSRYEPGQLLPTILTGETLDMDVVRNSSDAYTYPQTPPPAGQTTSNAFSYAAASINNDVEAYASGNQSRAFFRPPRSRSPTPFGDDDYRIANDGNVYSSGLSPPRQYFSTPQRNSYAGPTYVNTQYSYAEDAYSDGRSTPSALSSTLENDGEDEKRHFGPAPTGRVLRRHKSKKRVVLTNGNLVVDLSIPPKLVLPYKNEPEMQTTRYTAVTCDPDEFEKNNFFLRQNESQRTTELFIVITLYNEDELLFCRTLYGIMQNISHLCSRKNSQTWGPDAWKKVVVCIVADGRKKIHPRVLDCLALLGVYQPGGHMKNMIDNKPVTAHVFEYTTSFGLDPDLQFRYPDKGIMPTQIIFCLKEKNQKKINSHRWFFNAFSAMLQPNVCILLDVGTQPGPTSLYKLWKAFDLNSNVGGACGEIAVYKGKNWKYLLNPLVAAQNFEYKISSILDKPTESMFGYISVLPGAFSAYRYIALKNHADGTGPLASYFKGEVLHGRDTDIFTSNMYLAEDRILCFELVAKTNSNWLLKYVKGAIAETDVPDALPEFIAQRRRWLNGSLFASIYAVYHVKQILDSGQTTGRKIALSIETVYNVINLVFSWFSIGNYYLFFVILTSSLEDPIFHLDGIKFFNTIIQYIMGGLVIACFLFSMGNKPHTSRTKYRSASFIFAILTIYVIVCSVLCAVAAYSQGATGVMLLAVLVTYGSYASGSILALDPWHMITSFLPYILMAPTYINILNAYAFCNLDDISWGTKQDNIVDTDLGAVTQDSNHQVSVEIYTQAADVNGLYEDAMISLKSHKLRQKNQDTKTGHMRSIPEQEQRAKDYYANVRTNLLMVWVLTNVILVAGILTGVETSNTFNPNAGPSRTRTYMICILSFMAITSAIRFVASTMYLILVLITG